MEQRQARMLANNPTGCTHSKRVLDEVSPLWDLPDHSSQGPGCCISEQLPVHSTMLWPGSDRPPGLSTPGLPTRPQPPSLGTLDVLLRTALPCLLGGTRPGRLLFFQTPLCINRKFGKAQDGRGSVEVAIDSPWEAILSNISGIASV